MTEASESLRRREAEARPAAAAAFDRPEPPRGTRRLDVLFVLLLALLPLALVGPSVLGGDVFLPWDPARFPPAAAAMTPDERAAYLAQESMHDVTEIPALVVPELQLAREQLGSGHLPVWNPYARFGAPLFGNGLAAMAYPPNTALLLAFDPVRGLAYGAWLGLAIAGVLAFALLRELGLRPTAAAFGAFVFAFGGTLAVNLHFYMRLDALVWLPGLLLACLRIDAAESARRRVLPTLGLAGATALTLLAGFPPYAVASLLLTGAVAVVLLARRLRRGGAAETAGWLLAGALLGVLLAGVQLAPMFAFFPDSNRPLQASVDATRGQGFDPMGLFGYVMPHVFGEPGGEPAYANSALAYLLFDRRTEAGDIVFPHNFNFVEYTVFAGTLGLLLALVGAFGTRRKGRGVALALGLVFLALALAPRWLSPVYELPILGSIPPMRYVGPLALVVAGLAALGFDVLQGTRARRAVPVVAGLALLGAAAAFVLAAQGLLADGDRVVERLLERYRPQAPTLTADVVHQVAGGEAGLAAAAERLDASLRRAGWALGLGGLLLGGVYWAQRRSARRVQRALLAAGALLTVVELLWFADPLAANRAPVPEATRTPIHAFLQQQRDAHAQAGGITVARAARYEKAPIDLPAGTLFPERVRDLNSYAFVDGRSHLPWLALYGPIQMIRGYWPKAFLDDERLERPLFDLLGLRYVLAHGVEPLRHAGQPVGPVVEGEDGTFRVYERSSALPRAFVVHDVRAPGEEPRFSAPPDASETWAREARPEDVPLVRALIEPDLDPRGAVLATPDVAAELRALPHGPAPEVPRAVEFVETAPDALRLAVGAGPPGFLVLQDAALPGWTATVGGVPTPIRAGNLFMRVVPVPEGPVEVRFDYRPPGLLSGLAMTALGVAAVLALLVWRHRTRSRPASAVS